MKNHGTVVLEPHDFGFDGALLPAVLEMWVMETDIFSLFEEALASYGSNSNELITFSRNLGRFRKLSSIFETEDLSASPALFRDLLRRVIPYKKILQEAGASLGVSLLSDRTAAVKMKEDIAALAAKHKDLISPRAKAWIGEGLFDEAECRLAGTDVSFESGYLTRFFAGKLQGDESSEYDAALVGPRVVSGFSAPVVIYVATIGPGIDGACAELMKKGGTYEACLLNSIGAGAVESAAADLCAYFTRKMADGDAGKAFRRISPGYHDLDIKEQRKIFSLLKPEEDIGVHLNEGNIMIPEKSTSGMMSIKEA